MQSHASPTGAFIPFSEYMGLLCFNVRSGAKIQNLLDYVDYFGGEEKFLYQQERDNALRLYCKEHRIKLIEIPYNKINDIENILNKFGRL